MRAPIAVAGASGFVGTHLCARLAEAGHKVVALSRSGRAPVDHPSVQGRRCDLFSVLDIERALEGVDQAAYLVHSMLPSARLEQASFEDMDAVLADNFARGCEIAGVGHTVYLGGLIPQDGAISPHLESRREVETILARPECVFFPGIRNAMHALFLKISTAIDQDRVGNSIVHVERLEELHSFLQCIRVSAANAVHFNCPHINTLMLHMARELLTVSESALLQ